MNCTKVSKDPVVSVTIMNSEITPENIVTKDFRIDIRAKIDKSEIIVIEMQCVRNPSMIARLMDYGTDSISNQLRRDEYYDDLKRVICIAVLDFVLFKDDERFWRKSHMRDDETKEIISDLLELQFLELPKVRKMDDSNPLTFWAEFLKHPDSEEINLCDKVPL